MPLSEMPAQQRMSAFLRSRPDHGSRASCAPPREACFPPSASPAPSAAVSAELSASSWPAASAAPSASAELSASAGLDAGSGTLPMQPSTYLLGAASTGQHDGPRQRLHRRTLARLGARTAARAGRVHDGEDLGLLPTPHACADLRVSL